MPWTRNAPSMMDRSVCGFPAATRNQAGWLAGPVPSSSTASPRASRRSISSYRGVRVRPQEPPPRQSRRRPQSTRRQRRRQELAPPDEPAGPNQRPARLGRSACRPASGPGLPPGPPPKRSGPAGPSPDSGGRRVSAGAVPLPRRRPTIPAVCAAPASAWPAGRRRGRAACRGAARRGSRPGRTRRWRGPIRAVSPRACSGAM